MKSHSSENKNNHFIDVKALRQLNILDVLYLSQAVTCYSQWAVFFASYIVWHFIWGVSFISLQNLWLSIAQSQGWWYSIDSISSWRAKDRQPATTDIFSWRCGGIWCFWFTRVTLIWHNYIHIVHHKLEKRCLVPWHKMNRSVPFKEVCLYWVGE